MLRRRSLSSPFAVAAATAAGAVAGGTIPIPTQRRGAALGPADRLRHRTLWYRCYPDITTDRWRDMYHSFYPYLFDHGEKMSLYPKIPENPREWQPGQLLTTYDAIREDKYDAFIKLRAKFPELYEDTHLWDNPPPFGEFNQFYSVRFGMIGIKAFTCTEYDEYGNEMNLTALWFPDNQVLAHRTLEQDGRNSIFIGATNVPAEFHRPHITSAYKAMRVPCKHVSSWFPITPDAFAPVGTKLDVRHFKVGQDALVSFQEEYYGNQGVMFKHGFDGGPVWLGSSKWQRRPGSIGTKGDARVLPGRRMGGHVGGGRLSATVPVYRIDYKHSLIYIVANLRSDIGGYITLRDVTNINNKTSWNQQRGFPPFPTFVPDPNEDLSTASTEDCQIVSLPLLSKSRDEAAPEAAITQADIDDARSAKPVTAPPKKEVYDYAKYVTSRRKHQKVLRDERKSSFTERNYAVSLRQDEVRRKKLLARRRVT